MENFPLRRIRRQLGLRQKELAKRLDITQQALSYLERQTNPPSVYRARLLHAFPDQEGLIQEIFDGTMVGLGREAVHQAAQTPEIFAPEPPNTEEEAQLWAMSFRNRVLLDRLAYLARCAGLRPQSARDSKFVLRDALFLAAGNGQPSEGPLTFEELLFPGRPHGFLQALTAGTLIIVGSPDRHPFTRWCMEVLEQDCKIRVRFDPLESQERGRYMFFGYHAALRSLVIEGHRYHPNRYVCDRGAVVYEDYGVILHAPFDRIVDPLERPFGKDAMRILLIAGTHRLGTGVGVRLVETSELRALVLQDDAVYDFDRVGGFAYRVVVRSGDFTQSSDNFTTVNVSLVQKW